MRLQTDCTRVVSHIHEWRDLALQAVFCRFISGRLYGPLLEYDKPSTIMDWGLKARGFMMRAVFGLVLLIGMGLAGFAVYMVNQYMETQASQLQQERQRSATAIRTVDIYAPSRSLTYGERLTIDDVKIIKYARDFLPNGVFATEEELFPEGVNVPRIVRIPMQENEPILTAKVTEAGAPQGITALLDPGMRAFPLPVGLTQAFAGDLEMQLSELADRVDFVDVACRIGVGDQFNPCGVHAIPRQRHSSGDIGVLGIGKGRLPRTAFEMRGCFGQGGKVKHILGR